jgi:hypothetical protein
LQAGEKVLEAAFKICWRFSGGKLAECAIPSPLSLFNKKLIVKTPEEV